jgi:hypothetical protein
MNTRLRVGLSVGLLVGAKVSRHDACYGGCSKSICNSFSMSKSHSTLSQ